MKQTLECDNSGSNLLSNCINCKAIVSSIIAEGEVDKDEDEEENT